MVGEEGDDLVLRHRVVEGRVHQDGVGSQVRSGPGLVVGAADIRLAAADNHRGNAGDLVDDGPDRDLALVVVDPGELARSAQGDEPPGAVVEQPSGGLAHRLWIDGVAGAQGRQQRGDAAVQVALEWCHRLPPSAGLARYGVGMGPNNERRRDFGNCEARADRTRPGTGPCRNVRQARAATASCPRRCGPPHPATPPARGCRVWTAAWRIPPESR